MVWFASLPYAMLPMHVTAGYQTDNDIKLEHIKKIQALIYFYSILWLKDHFDALKALENQMISKENTQTDKSTSTIF